ncbi:MAG: tetratricopeptide repeat protein [Myxococcaceae bacterium]|nr:tetratricopeptide repeat protein [Myxococcaceae bacterium]
MAHLDAAEIARFLRGQLSPEHSAQVEQHLATCAQCSERVSESQGITEAPPDQDASYVTEAAFAASNNAAGVAPPREPATPKWVLEGRPPERGEQVGRYLILERVGQGGMGIVYAAWDPDLGRRVAIKLLRTDKQHAEGRTIGQARLLREAQAMARVTHPHVISVFDVGTLGEGVFVAMEFVDGTTLKKWIKEKPRPWSEVLDTFLAAGRGLAGAHAAGLVHRDFKPDNVLIGKDGRIRVTDFGLARMAEEGAEPPRAALPEGTPVEEAPDLAQLTQDGHAVGTLMYMSPEQRRGDAPDARADQFSFCVALYWALYGAWPFERQRSSQRGPDSGPGSSHKGTSRPSQRTADPRPVDPSTGAFEPPTGSKVPAFLRQAILRGLSPEPKDRFPSMEALLARLEYKPRRVRLAAAAASLVVVAGLGGYAWYAQQLSEQRAQLCTGAEQKLAGLWDDAARRRVTDALVATGGPDAADVASRVTRMLDGYASAWVEASTEACRATRIRGEQTEQLLSLRVVCLERRLQDVKAVAGLLSAADAELLPKAVDTVSFLPSLQGCAEVTTLSQVEPRPEAPKARQEIDRISGELAQVKALVDAGRYKQARGVVEPALKAASALGYRPLEAEALLWQGLVKVRDGEPEAAEQELVKAFRAALASRDDVLLTRAASSLVYAISPDLSRPDDALAWGETAKAALLRMGGNEDLEAELYTHLGGLYVKQNKGDEALAVLQRALQLSERAHGTDHLLRAAILGQMGGAYKRQGKFEEASRMLRESIAIRERVSGPNHPMVGFGHFSLSQTLARLKDYEKAEFHANHSLKIHIAAFGPEHAETSTAYDLVGEIYVIQGKFREALPVFQKSLEIKEKAVGKDHQLVSYSVAGLAQCHVGLGQPERALPYFERVLALSHNPRTLAETHYSMARAFQALGRKRAQIEEAARKAITTARSLKEEALAQNVEEWLASTRGAKGSTRTARRR